MAIESTPITKEVVVEQRTRLMIINTPRGPSSGYNIEFHRERNEIVDDVVEHTSNDPTVVRNFLDIVPETYECEDGTVIGPAHIAEYLKVKGDEWFMKDNPTK